MMYPSMNRTKSLASLAYCRKQAREHIKAHNLRGVLERIAVYEAQGAPVPLDLLKQRLNLQFEENA